MRPEKSHSTKFDPPAEKSQDAKADAGKLEIDLVPMQIVKDIAEVRMYGTKTYKDPDNWKKVELRRYINALLRHTLAFVSDVNSVDEESGIAHYKHMACNLSFICHMMANKGAGHCVHEWYLVDCTDDGGVIFACSKCGERVTI